MTANLSLASSDFPLLDIRQVAGNIGAEITNITLSDQLDDQTFAQLEQALVHYKVLFFRNQGHLTDHTQQAFGARFGQVVPHPTVPAPQGTKLLELDSAKGNGRADSWHTDVTFVPDFPKISILRGVIIPPFGGDTVWANTAHAYDQLPESLKRYVESLRAVHSNDYDYAAERVVTDSHRLAHHQQVFVSSVWEAEHPLVHVHPLSGERALLLGHFFKKLVGYSNRESARIFELLQNRITRLENTVRWQWQQGDVAIWDNLTTQHYAVNDYGNQQRLVRRVTIAGEIARGVDGTPSRSLTQPNSVTTQVA